MIVDIHTRARRVGNSWAIIIPKEKAKIIGLDAETDLHVDIEPVSKLVEIAGTLKTKKSTEQIMKEIDEGWK